MILTIIVSGLIIYAMCWALHGFSNYLDFNAPAKAEKKYKETIEKKYHIKGAEPNNLIGLTTKNAEALHKKAMAHANHLLKDVTANDMTGQQKEYLFRYYYQNYIERHKLSYT